MADALATLPHGHGPADPAKRDFLKLVTVATAAVGVGAIVWPIWLHM